MVSILSTQEFFYGKREPASAYDSVFYGHTHSITDVAYDRYTPGVAVTDYKNSVQETGWFRSRGNSFNNDNGASYLNSRLGYTDPAQETRSRGSSSNNYGASYLNNSRLVLQGSRDRRLYGDSRAGQRYSRTYCPGYRKAAAITHYVNVNPTIATRFKSGVAWSS